MTTIELSSEELEILRDVLQHGVDEVDVEIFRTDTHDFKQMLKHRKEVLEGVLEKMAAMPMAA